jgi:hypothetical protein
MTASSSRPRGTTPESEPQLRHEFVGMMFAVAVGEVGVQTAILVQAHNWVHFLPAYFHLLLATVLIATSWVGWTLSPSPGARTDVRSVFEWEFFVLLLDVLLVVIYFILARSVDITGHGDGDIQLKASAAPEAFWIFVVFCVYLVWDFVSKIPLYTKNKRSEPWFRNYGVRIVPTLFCSILAYVTKRLVADVDPPHVLTADLSLIFLILLFRALKDLTSAMFPRAEVHHDLVHSKRVRAMAWSLLFGLCFVLGIMWTWLWPIPERIAVAIKTGRSDNIHAESPISIQRPAEATVEH